MPNLLELAAALAGTQVGSMPSFSQGSAQDARSQGLTKPNRTIENPPAPISILGNALKQRFGGAPSAPATAMPATRDLPVAPQVQEPTQGQAPIAPQLIGTKMSISGSGAAPGSLAGPLKTLRDLQKPQAPTAPSGDIYAQGEGEKVLSQQAGVAIGQLEQIEQHRQQLEQRTLELSAKVNDSIISLNYGGKDPTEIRNLMDQVDASKMPGATEQQKQAGMSAALSLKKAEENPSDNQPGFQKFMTSIALAMGTFGAIMSKTPNYVADYVQQQVRNEADRQEREYRKNVGKVEMAKSAYAIARENFSDATSAKQAAQALIYKNIEIEMQRRGLQSRDQQQAQKMQLAQKELMMNAAKGQAAIEQQQAALAIEAQGKAGVNPFKAVPTTVAAEITKNHSLQDQLSDLREAFAATNVGAISALGSKLGFKVNASTVYTGMRDLAAQMLGGANNAGVLNESEFKRFSAILASAGDNTAGGLQAIDNVLHMVEQKAFNHYAEAGNYMGVDAKIAAAFYTQQHQNVQESYKQYNKQRTTANVQVSQDNN